MIFQAIGFARYCNHMGMMQHPVKNRIGYNRVIKNFIPFIKIHVSGQYGAFLFVPAVSQLKKQIGILFVNRKISDFINDQQFIMAKMTETGIQTVLQFCLF